MGCTLTAPHEAQSELLRANLSARLKRGEAAADEQTAAALVSEAAVTLMHHVMRLQRAADTSPADSLSSRSCSCTTEGACPHVTEHGPDVATLMTGRCVPLKIGARIKEDQLGSCLRARRGDFP